MKNLWSPWRLEYVQGLGKPQEGQCVFCRLAQADLDDQSLVLHRDQDAFVVLNRYPYNNGHLMVIPCRHVARLSDLEPAIVGKLFQWSAVCTKALEQEFSVQGFNIGMNLGDVAGAGIAAHLHLHVVPRWKGDTNFMPVIAEIKCIPDHLSNTYGRLKHLSKALKECGV